MKRPHEVMREIRKQKGITQTCVANELGFSSSQVYANIEYGHTELKFEVAMKVAEILGVSVYEFIENKEGDEIMNDVKVTVTVKKDESVRKLEEFLEKLEEVKTLADELTSLIELEAK